MVYGLENQFCDENAVRKDLLPSECVAIWRAVQEHEKEKAKDRMRRGGPRAGKLPDLEKGQTRDRIGPKAGLSGRTIEKATAVVSTARLDEPHEGDRITRTGCNPPRCRLIEARQFLCGEFDIERGEVLFQIGSPLRARDGYD